MGYRLGVDVGASYTAATIDRSGSGDARSNPAPGDTALVPSVVHVDDAGQRSYGRAAAERAAMEPDRVLRGFLQRVGDPTPMLPSIAAATAHDITADFVAWTVAQATRQEGTAPDHVAVTHPAHWGPHKRALLADALAAADLPTVSLVPTAIAAVQSAMPAAGRPAGSTVAVVDLGGRTLEVTLVRRSAAAGWVLAPRGATVTDLGGVDLDDAIVAQVLADLPAPARAWFAAASTEDPATATAMAELRNGCVRAKEVLSAQTAATVPVQIEGTIHQVRVTRAEFEAAATPVLEAAADLLAEALDTANHDPADLDALLVCGGSSRIPLVTQVLSRRFGVRVVSAGDLNPAALAALGAARCAATTVAIRMPAPAPAPDAMPTFPRPADAADDLAGAGPALEPEGEPTDPTQAAAAPIPGQGPGSRPPGAGRPIRHHRSGRRADVVGLDAAQRPPSAATLAAPTVAGPRSVVPAGPVHSVSGLATQLRPDRPQRPAFGDLSFPEQAQEQLESARRRGPLFTVRRTLALTALTATIFCGSGAWVPAIPAITESPSSPSASIGQDRAEHSVQPIKHRHPRGKQSAAETSTPG